MPSCVLPILAQAGDTPEAPLYLALTYGYAPAVLGFLVDCVRRRGVSLLRMAWMLIFLALIFAGWRSLFVADALWAEDLLTLLVLGSMAVGIGTAIYFLLSGGAPAEPP